MAWQFFTADKVSQPSGRIVSFRELQNTPRECRPASISSLGRRFRTFLAGEPKKLGKVIRAANVKLELG